MSYGKNSDNDYRIKKKIYWCYDYAYFFHCMSFFPLKYMNVPAIIIPLVDEYLLTACLSCRFRLYTFSIWIYSYV